MQAVVFDEPRRIEIRDVPVPRVGPREALVRVEAAGICGTDVHIFEGNFVAKFPLIPGHEFAGVIEEVGAEVRGFAPGDRVAVDPSIYCESCYFCKQNKQNHCLNWNALGVTRPGAFAEYVAVPQQCLFRIETISFAEAAFVEPLACVVYGQERARPAIGDSVLIFGAGPIGLLHQQLAKRAGAALVATIDVRPERLDLARRLGADYAFANDGTLADAVKAIAPYGFDVVIDATGVPGVVEGAIQYVKNAGKLLVFGVCPNDSRITVNPYEIYKRDLQIIGSFAIKKTFQAALDLLERRALDVQSLVGMTLNIADFTQGLRLMAEGRAPMKVQIHPQSRQARVS